MSLYIKCSFHFNILFICVKNCSLKMIFNKIIFSILLQTTKFKNGEKIKRVKNLSTKKFLNTIIKIYVSICLRN